MASITGPLRDAARPVRRAGLDLGRLLDPAYRRRRREILADFRRTRRDVGSWARTGGEGADPERRYAILSFTNIPVHAKMHSLIAKALQQRGFKPVIFTTSRSTFAHRYYRLFGVGDFVAWDRFVAGCHVGEGVIDDATTDLHSASLDALVGIRFHDVEVGKHALSMTCRERVEGHLDLADPDTAATLRRHLRAAVRHVVAAETFFASTPVQGMLVRDAGYLPHGPIYEVARRMGVDCVVSEIGQRRGTWIFQRQVPETRGRHFFSLAPSTWERVAAEPWTDEHDRALEAEFAGRYLPDSTDDTRRLMTGKREKGPDEIRTQLGLDPKKKTAVIFSHIAWDAAFFFGTCLFGDFETWLYETVRYAAERCPQINWVVKLHPFNAFKLQREAKDEESEMELLRSLMPLPDHVRILRATTDLNTRSLFAVTDYVLTVNGTVGMEFPCFGIPALLAGTGRYDRRGFTIDPASREEYLATLSRLHEIPHLTREQQVLARKHFYAVTRRRQTSIEDVARMELKRLHEAQSDVHDNIVELPRSLAEFERSTSMRRIADWLAYERTPDLLEPDVIEAAGEPAVASPSMGS